MARKLKEFKHYIAQDLLDPEFAIAYLNEALADDDKRIFLIALKNVVDAHAEREKIPLAFMVSGA